ncbi:hypothetical protein ZIOFF_068200 [Zingiber officinale]|uniref:Ribosomal protein L34Ae n=1 Tax=Zingiber officinale TaxID=94328 RepID=A0A8J5ET70_ZINOF|nr:hypothetical protein ZIOFF_068200 [Zingiber officinale]
MEFLKIRSFRGIGKFKVKKDSNQDRDLMNLDLEKPNDEVLDTMPKADVSDHVVKAVEDEDDDDFVTNEVKRRLKELRKNSFMVFIPEEGYPEEEEGGGSSSSGWRESEEGGDAPWCTFNAIYAKYTERMTFFDKLMVKSLKEAAYGTHNMIGSLGASKHSQSSLSKKLYMNLLNLPIKAQNGHCDGNEILRSQQEDSPCENLEAAYVSQVCLSWEILHKQYMQLKDMTLSQYENEASYSYAAQAFQQFQVLLQRFIENEPFEMGTRIEVFAHARISLPKLLQVPNCLGMNEKGVEDSDEPVLATDLIKIIEESILTFLLFLRMDKKKSGFLFQVQSSRNPLQQLQASFEKKEIKVKEILRRKKGWKKKTWPETEEEVELLFTLVDIKVISRVLRMRGLTKEQLLWCEEKMSRLDDSDKKSGRVLSSNLFPC